MNQETALRIMKSGKNIFLTGQAGSGKTYTLNQYINWCRDCDIPIAITAATGIAATHIGGVTIHSRSGIGIGSGLSEEEVYTIATKNRVRSNIQKAEVLIIDEVSMLSAQVLDDIQHIIKAVKYNDAPWGGMQIIFCGDFFQLPPISKHGDDASRFAFAAGAWNQADLHFCYLDTQHRQQENGKFQKILNALRVGELTDDMITDLEHRRDTVFQDDTSYVRLYTHNADVDRINSEQLGKLGGESKKYQAGTKGNKKFAANLLKGMLAPEILELKVDAHVLFVKNNPTAGYLNGTTGIVIGFDEDTSYPLVQITDGETIVVEPETRNIENEHDILASVRQIPLKLARAITVHKSQGMTLDAVEIDLSKSFAYGQSYVALSRVRSLEGLRLLGLNKDSLRAHPLVLRGDHYFQQQSTQLSEQYLSHTDAQREELHKDFVKSAGGTYQPESDRSNTQKSPKQLKKKKPKVNTLEATIKYITTGNSLGEIATARDLKPNTILTHIIKIAKLHPDIDISRFAPDQKLIKLVQLGVEEVSQNPDSVSESGEIRLGAIYQALGEEVSYDDIKLCLAFLPTK